jgi:tetratricopeptide (TPR) repeat protein
MAASLAQMPDIDEAAINANGAGAELANARRFIEAIPHYEKAVSLAPDWYAPHMNLGIACKHNADWARSLPASLRALELDPERAGSGALWNAGVAATALGDWTRARWAWSQLGIKLPAGDGPIDMNIGITPIRVSCDKNPEVLWCHRLDPARARVESIPTPESDRRYRDLLLHDGEPMGKRRYGERELSVFNELAVLERSPFQTWRVDLVAPSEAEVSELFRAVAEGGDAALEDWTASLEILCKQCSEGVPHEHVARPEAPWKPERTIGIATTDDAVFVLIEKWAKSGRQRAVSQPELLLR